MASLLKQPPDVSPVCLYKNWCLLHQPEGGGGIWILPSGAIRPFRVLAVVGGHVLDYRSWHWVLQASFIQCGPVNSSWSTHPHLLLQKWQMQFPCSGGPRRLFLLVSVKIPTDLPFRGPWTPLGRCCLSVWKFLLQEFLHGSDPDMVLWV